MKANFFVVSLELNWFRLELLIMNQDGGVYGMRKIDKIKGKKIIEKTKQLTDIKTRREISQRAKSGNGK